MRMVSRVAQRRAHRRRVAWALLMSLLTHMAAILAVAWFYFSERSAPPDPVEEIEITFIEPPPPQEAKPMFVDTTAPTAPPPEQAVFESDRDTAAASPEAAQGAEPVPSQEGREQPYLELQEQELAMAQPDAAPPAPEVPPSRPAPVQPAEEAEPQAEKPDEEKPSEPDPEAVLLARSEPPREKQESREVPQPPAPPPSRPSFQRQTRATRLRGSVDSSGRAAVASLATPLGRYRKAISDAIGSSWYYHIGPRMDMFGYGTVTVIFLVDRDGKVRRPKVISNTSNESFEIVTLESILAAEIPPIPPDVLPALDGGQIEIDFSFSIITN